MADRERDDPEEVARERERERERQREREAMRERGGGGGGKVDAFATAQELVVPGATPVGFHHERHTGAKESFFQRWRGPILGLAFALVALAVWQIVYMLQIWPPVFVPSPRAVWDAFIRTSTVHDGVKGWSDYFLYQHLWASLRRILIGSLVAVGVGVPLGLLLGTSRWARGLFEPGITFIRALPPLAYFSLLVIWFGIEETPKVLLLVLAALPPVVLATSDAVRNVSQDRLIALRTLGASQYQVVRYGVFPSVLPEIMTGIRVAVLFAFTTVVAAETINGMPGIGGMVRDAQRFNQTDVVIMGIIVIGIAGIVLDLIVQLLDRVLVPWGAEL